MNEQDNRKSPEEFLKAIKEEEKQEGKGQLKIFLGMAAGVGKTYSMLEEAQEIKRDGVDVVIGIVETHGRLDTAALTAHLVTIPPKQIDYRGIEFKELDVDQIIKVHPKVVLVDELAHSNVPGSKHAKRWQDVLDILDAGIDVYTTLNVQHIESLNDVIKGITDISIRETVPDSIIEMAASIRIVDLTPSDLLERLKEGKVYLGNQSKIAIQHFFQKDTLTALREIVLRYAAEKVDRDLRQMLPADERTVEWKPREKFLVGVSHHSFSQKLIRMTRRQAFNIDAPWIALHVNTGATLSDKEAQTLEKNLAMARDLGAEVMTINDPDIASGIERVARQRGITQIFLGVQRPEAIFGVFKQATVFDKVLNLCPEIDVHVIREEKEDEEEYKSRHPFRFSLQLDVPSYFWILVYITLITLLNWFLLPHIGYKVAGSIFLVGILGLSLFFKKGPIFLACLLFGIIWTFFFIPPVGEVGVTANEDIVLLVLYLVTGLTSGILIDRAREHRQMLLKSEATTQTLYEIVRQIANSNSPEETIKFLKAKLSKSIDGSYDFIIKEFSNGIDFNHHPLIDDEKEKNAAIWVYENGKEAGWSTDTLPSAQNLYLPLHSYHQIVGIMVYRSVTGKKLPLEDKSFLYTVCQQLANFLERISAFETSKQNEYLFRMEEVQKKIFEQFLDAFEFPIAEAEEALVQLKSRIGKNLIEIATIEKSFEMIVQILNNIAAIIQISEGMLPLTKKENDLAALIKDCCETLQVPALEHSLHVKIAENLPLVPCDEYLIEILICNLILNAVKYSPKGSTIEIEAKREGNYFAFSVADQGTGYSQAQLDNLYQKFQRLSEGITAGMGLGLAISKTIAEVHDGKLIAETTPDEGEKFTLYLPFD